MVKRTLLQHLGKRRRRKIKVRSARLPLSRSQYLAYLSSQARNVGKVFAMPAFKSHINEPALCRHYACHKLPQRLEFHIAL